MNSDQKTIFMSNLDLTPLIEIERNQILSFRIFNLLSVSFLNRRGGIMLVVPVTRKINWKKPPVVTIAIILIAVFVFFVIQRNDHQLSIQAENFYFDSGLAQIELPYYLKFLNRETGASHPDPEKLNKDQAFAYHMELESDFEFLEKLRTNQIIKPSAPEFSEWKSQRTEYKNIRSKIISYTYGFKPAGFQSTGFQPTGFQSAFFQPITLVTSLFLHGSIGHLIGNMIFLWLVGCILEAGCGRLFYPIMFLITGICASLFFKLVYFNSPIPLIGASGAISGLMGAFAVLFGQDKIKVFYSLGFFFNYLTIRGIYLFILWMGIELLQLFWGERSNIAYVAHIGGLLAGGCAAFILLKIPDTVDRNLFKEDIKDTITPMVETALEKISKLDIEGGKKILDQAFENDPGNLQVLTQLFQLHKQHPDTKAFHDIGEALLTALIENREYGQAYDRFKEYQNAVRVIRLSPRLLVRLCFVFCDLGHPDPAGKIILRLLKKDKTIPGLSAALFKISLAYKQKGNLQNCKKCQTYICSQFPDSNEAALVANAGKVKSPV